MSVRRRGHHSTCTSPAGSLPPWRAAVSTETFQPSRVRYFAIPAQRMRRQRDDGRAIPGLAELRGGGVAVQLGHLHVHEDQVKGLARERHLYREGIRLHVQNQNT